MLTMRNSVSDPELGQFMVRLISLLRQANARNRISQFLRPFFGFAFSDFFIPKTDANLATYIGGDNDLRVMLIDGVETSRQTAGLIAGYDSSLPSNPLQGFNHWLDTAADLSMAQGIAGWQNNENATLRVYGYSAGGAVGQHVVEKFQRDRINPNWGLTTFGSPRAMSFPRASRLFNGDVCRWMCDADPIPFVPPRFEEAPILAAVLPVSALVRYGTYIHLQNGFSLDPAGVATPAFVPPVAALNVVGSLVNWYFGVANDPSNPHALTNYDTRLGLLHDRTPDTQAGIGAGFDDEAPENAPRRQVDRQANHVAAQVAHAAAIQNATAVEINRTVLFRAVRFRRIWCVALGDQLFAYAGNKKRARHLARVGNDFLRSMPKQAVVDPDSLLSQLTAFFNAAVVPGGPVSPPIRIGL